MSCRPAVPLTPPAPVPCLRTLLHFLHDAAKERTATPSFPIPSRLSLKAARSHQKPHSDSHFGTRAKLCPLLRPKRGLPAPNSNHCHTYEKRARKSFLCHTYKNKGLTTPLFATHPKKGRVPLLLMLTTCQPTRFLATTTTCLQKQKGRRDLARRPSVQPHARLRRAR